ncbi:uncharacterized protein LOC128858323 [Anastrepha ludens]|uniref:uncharacterized protein LOC128858323 n=1 Tax=Anastrepha ludens TaxID=28586 RepID=UPI0023B04EA6|nr:uncharacterized protein LOC128858323 [Anastrepha ludens]
MHFCRICRTEKNLKYTVKELRKFSRKRCNDRLLCTTPTLGNICHDCEERLHNFHRLDDHEDNERIIVDDDELLYNLFFERVEQQRLMKRLKAVGGGAGGGEWCTTNLRQQTLVAATAGATVNGVDEVIEVLTSRENTPSPALPVASSPLAAIRPATNMGTNKFHKENIVTTTARDDKTSLTITATDNTTSITSTATKKTVASSATENSSSYKVVAVINLDDDEEMPTGATSTVLKPQESLDTDEEEIVFRKVEPEDLKKSNNKKRSKKNSRKGKYQHRQINLIASLSLVSSDDDSDVEVTDPECSPEKTNAPPKPIGDQQVSTTQISPAPTNTDDSVNQPTKIALVENVQHQGCLNAGVKCPVCQTEFTASQRLIHHMRRKHRSYDGEVLSERPRCAQDSAMTIRLRYMQRYTYYECQLCGCIDAIFKAHKEHVMEQHAAESKSLKDPMMQSLKCPACKEKCGTQHALLLRHMLQSQKAAECRAHFRQVTHIRNLFSNCGSIKEKELHRTARIYQISKRKQYFFECLQCHKIITGYFNHLKHQKTHNKIINNKNVTTDVPEASPLTTAVPTLELGPRVMKQSCVESKAKCEKPKPAPITKELSAKKKLSIPPQINPQKNGQPHPRRERKLTKKAIQAALLKVKVKPPLKQFSAHRYKCKLCVESFKGFHRLNLHILRVHESEDGSLRCNICLLRFADNNELENHEHKRHLHKQKRKSVGASKIENGDVFEQEKRVENNRFSISNKRRHQSALLNRIAPGPIDTKLVKKENLDVEKESVANIWLKELLALAAENRLKISNNSNNNHNNKNCNEEILECNTYADCQKKAILENRTKHREPSIIASQQCLYCAHLFSSVLELHTHEKLHAQRQEVKMLKRCKMDNFTANSVSS